MKKMIAVMIRILLFPFRAVIRIITGLILAAMKLSSLITGPFLTLLVILGVFSLVRQEWRNVAVLAGIGAVLAGLYFAAGCLCGVAEAVCERLRI